MGEDQTRVELQSAMQELEKIDRKNHEEDIILGGRIAS